MEKINITIPTGLSPEEEIIAMARQLCKGLMPHKQTAIGNGYTIQQLQTQITITREPVEKVIVTRECSCCGTIFEEILGKRLYVNYGGLIRSIKLCSEECREIVITHSGDGRTAIQKKNLRLARLF